MPLHLHFFPSRLEISMTIQEEWCLHDTCSLNALRVTYVSALLDFKVMKYITLWNYPDNHCWQASVTAV